jgi:hypothetical protein
MDNIQEFLSDIRDVHPDVIDYADCFTVAMDSVPNVIHEGEKLFFGQIGDGTFFSGHDIERCRWYPDTNPIEALGLVRLEFGDEIAEELAAW